MNCPACQTTLLMTERQGIEIDYCPTCRGVWLDRGELDKLIERASTPLHSDRPAAGYEMPPDLRRDDDDNRYKHDRGQPQHRKKSFWSEMFDFD